MHKKRGKGCMNQWQGMTAKKQCLPDPTGLAHIETYWDWSNMHRSKPDGVSGLEGKAERNSIPNSEAIFKCQLLAEEKRAFFSIGILLSIQTSLMPIMARTMWTQCYFWRPFFVFVWAFFLPLLLFCICVMVFDFVFLSACGCACVCVYLHMLAYMFLIFYSFSVYFFFSKEWEKEDMGLNG